MSATITEFRIHEFPPPAAAGPPGGNGQPHRPTWRERVAECCWRFLGVLLVLWERLRGRYPF